MNNTVFISDLHLHESRPNITALFLDFLCSEAMYCNGLFILGDLFEAWVGDDESSDLANAIKQGLRQVTSAGVPVYFMRGNRDFLVGARFAHETGLCLLPDPAVILLHGQPTLLMHGDLLCSDDHAYQAFRQQTRNRAWQDAFLERSLAERHAFAAQARAASKQRHAELIDDNALETITDVNADTVLATMTQYGISRLIHGHTHRPAIHALHVNGQPAQRIVLGDWYEQGSVCRVNPDGITLTALA